MKSYDIFLTAENSSSLVYTGCLSRRFLAASIDVIVLGVLLAFIGIEGESNFAGLFNLSILLIVLFLPEILWRQTIGMYFCNLVVLVPPESHPVKSLLIRRGLNIIEFSLPSSVYYFLVSFSKGNRSLSDRASSCVLARKHYLFDPPKEAPLLNKSQKILIPLMFSFLPLFGFVALCVMTFFFIGGSLFWELLFENFGIQAEQAAAHGSY